MKNKRNWTKDKLSITIDNNILNYLNENIDNKSKYIEYLIYQDIKSKNLIKKELYIL